MATKRPKDLPAVTTPTAGDKLMLDGASTRSITVENFGIWRASVTETLTNKTLTSPIIAATSGGSITITDGNLGIVDNADPTKAFQFDAANISPATTRIFGVPNANTTLVGTDATQILTNKTLTSPAITATAGGSITIADGNLGIVDNVDNTKAFQFDAANITTGTTCTFGVPNANTTLVGTDATQTLTNKTLTAPVIATIVNTGTLTLPTSADTLVGRATTDTLTNKTISGASNTLSNIALSSHATQAAFTLVGNNTSGAAAPTAIDIAALTTKASPAAGDYIILSDQAATGAFKKATVSSVASAGSVSSIAGNTGAFTLSNGITNSANDIRFNVAASGLRIPLTANTNYYVRTDGNDSNTGTANTSGGAWLTLQKAANYIAANIDLNGFVATVNVGAGTYTGGVSCFRPFVGGSLADANGGVIFSGDTTTPANVIISTTSATCFAASFGAHFGVQGFKMTTTTVGDALYASAQGRIFINGKVEFGAVATGSYHMRANAQGWIGGGASYIVSGTSSSGHYSAQQGGMIEVSGVTVTISGSPTTSFWAYATACGHMNIQGNTYSGAVTAGTKFYVDYNSVINSGVTLPGATAGTQDTATGGRYI